MKTKFNLDRDNPTSDFIHSRQNFKKVLEGYQALKPPIWKNPWFYGPVGFASLALIFVFTFQTQLNAHGNNSTLTTTSNTSLPEDTPCIQPLSSGSDVPFQVVEVLPEDGKLIELASGTTISIPANTLNCENGSAVQIKIREFQDKESALLAGIPMDYGKNAAFESAGMIEIRAEKEGRPVELKTNKSMEVQLALTQLPENFQFWKLDESQKEWVETPCVLKSTTANSSKVDLKKIEEKIIQVEEKLDVCNNRIEEKLTAKTRTNLAENLIPSENAKKLIIEFNPNEFPELKGYKDIEWEYVVPANPTSVSLETFSKRIKYASSQTWNDVEIKKAKTDYTATFINSKEKYTLPIRPVLNGKSLSDLKNKINLAEIERTKIISKLTEEKKQYEKEEKALRLAQEKIVNQMKADLTREVVPSMEERSLAARSATLSAASTMNAGTANFRTTSFGVYNCDRPIPYPPHHPNLLTFKTKEGSKVNQLAAFVLDTKKNTRYSFGGNYPHKNDELGWFNHESILVLIDQDGNLFFKKNIQVETDHTAPIVMERLDRKEVTLENIQKIISETTVTV